MFTLNADGTVGSGEGAEAGRNVRQHARHGRNLSDGRRRNIIDRLWRQYRGSERKSQRSGEHRREPQ
jgi:hypothetical protein